jgi:hypothetical protein
MEYESKIIWTNLNSEIETFLKNYYLYNFDRFDSRGIKDEDGIIFEDIINFNTGTNELAIQGRGCNNS